MTTSLLQVVNRLDASCSIRLVKTCYPQACCNLFQQLATSLQISSCNKSDFHELASTWWIQQTCCNLLTTYIKPVKSTTCSKSVAFLAVYVPWATQKHVTMSREKCYWSPSYTRHLIVSANKAVYKLLKQASNGYYSNQISKAFSYSYILTPCHRACCVYFVTYIGFVISASPNHRLVCIESSS